MSPCDQQWMREKEEVVAAMLALGGGREST